LVKKEGKKEGRKEGKEGVRGGGKEGREKKRKQIFCSVVFYLFLDLWFHFCLTCHIEQLLH
jgi:hypothetical protein